MAAHVPPVADERESLIAYLDQQRDAFATVAFGLTEEQIRLAPTAGTLSIGGLVKHVTTCERGWTERMAAAPTRRAAGPSLEEQATAWGDDFRVTGGDTSSRCSRPGRSGRGHPRVLRRPTSAPQYRCRAMRRGSRTTSRPGRCAGCDAPRRGARTPRRARRHRPRVDRRGDDVRARGRARGMARDAVAQAVAPGGHHERPERERRCRTKAKGPWEYESQGPFWVTGRW